VPFRYTRELVEIVPLELLDKSHRNSYLSADLGRLTVIVASMAESFRCITIGELPIEGLLGKRLVGRDVRGPSEMLPAHHRNVSVEITALAEVEVLAVVEEVPQDGSDEAGLGLFEVNVTELHPGIGDKHPAHFGRDVLHVGAGEPAAAVAAQSSGVGACNIKSCAASSIRVKACLKESKLFSHILCGHNGLTDRFCLKILAKLFEGTPISSNSATLSNVRQPKHFIQ